MLWGKYADDLAKALITSAENVVKKHNITGAAAKRERRVLLHRVVNAVTLFLWTLAGR